MRAHHHQRNHSMTNYNRTPFRGINFSGGRQYSLSGAAQVSVSCFEELSLKMGEAVLIRRYQDDNVRVYVFVFYVCTCISI